MLRLKYFKEFKDGNPYVVILCDVEGIREGYNFFKGKDSAHLNSSDVVEYSDIGPLGSNDMYLNQTECQEIAQHLYNLLNESSPSHAYQDTEALGDEIEIILSHGEYPNLF